MSRIKDLQKKVKDAENNLNTMRRRHRDMAKYMYDPGTYATLVAMFENTEVDKQFLNSYIAFQDDMNNSDTDKLKRLQTEEVRLIENVQNKAEEIEKRLLLTYDVPTSESGFEAKQESDGQEQEDELVKAGIKLLKYDAVLEVVEKAPGAVKLLTFDDGSNTD